MNVLINSGEQDRGRATDEVSDHESPTISKVELILCLLAAATGFGNAFSIRLVGLMPASEIVLLGVSAYLATHVLLYRQLPAPLITTRIFLVLIICQAAALCSYVVSDFYRESATGDMIRGWARMAFLALDLLSIAYLFGSSRRIFVGYLLGVVASACSVFVVEPLFGDYWKFGYGYALTVAAVLLSGWAGGRMGIVGCAGMGAIHYLMDFRSMALTCLVISLLLLVNQFAPLLRKVAFIFAVIVLIAVTPFVWPFVTSSENARQSRSNAERSAMMEAATQAFVASPLLGHGSWFSNTHVMDVFVDLRSEKAQIAGVGGFDETDAGDMAIHSQILVSLAEGGLIGGTFFFAYGFMLLWSLYYCVIVRDWDWISAPFLFVLCGASFNLFFSPFSGPARVDIAVAACVALMLWKEHGEAIARQELGEGYSQG